MPPIMGMRLSKFKASFFDRAAVTSMMDRKTQKVLSAMGAFVRQTAKQSIKNPPRQKLGNMTLKERQAFHIRQEEARRKGRKVPSKPFTREGSPAGQPPYNRTGLLKRFILFGYDRIRQSVVIGPAKLNAKGQNVPGALEYGGRSRSAKGRSLQIDARPYMRPALEKELPKMPGLWKANS